MTLDLSSLQKAIGSLGRAIRVANSFVNGLDDQEEVIHAGVIQTFEFTYELCWKFMKRWLEANTPGQIVDSLTMKELFCMAAERQLIQNVEVWFEYHRARNKTSHTYDMEVAEDVYEAAVRFLTDAKAFLNTLENKND